ncbi:MAG TPA: DUF2914 domain-containing protein [Gammaproteobacteria bacterium]
MKQTYWEIKMKKMAIAMGTSLVFMLSSAAAFAQEEPASESPAPAAPAQEQKSMEQEATSKASTGTVARGIFTSAVENHEPVDQLTDADTNMKTLLFFTELMDFQGETVIHRWQYNGQNMAEVKFQVGGPRWRVWSSKNMMPEWVGTWTVSVVNGAGEVVASETLNYSAASEEAESAAAAAADSDAAETAPGETAQ